MLENIQYLAYHSPDQRVRLAASIDLRNYIDEREARAKTISASPVKLEHLLEELNELRRAQPTLELEEVRDTGELEPAAEASTEREEVSDAPADPE
jgi:hypothetical protein